MRRWTSSIGDVSRKVKALSSYTASYSEASSVWLRYNRDDEMLLLTEPIDMKVNWDTSTTTTRSKTMGVALVVRMVGKESKPGAVGMENMLEM